MKHTIRMPPEIWDRCMAHGKGIVHSYAQGNNPRSRLLGVQDRDSIHDNPKVQGFGKLFECAFCIWASIDIEELNWGKYSDDGYDIKIDDWRIDIKGSQKRTATKLIWPVSKNHFFDTLATDAFVFARHINNHQPAEIELVGWTTKEHFKSHHQTAGKRTEKYHLSEGTWFMEATGLWPMDDMHRVMSLEGRRMINNPIRHITKLVKIGAAE